MKEVYKANKDYPCDLCSETIKKGELYERWSVRVPKIINCRQIGIFYAKGKCHQLCEEWKQAYGHFNDYQKRNLLFYFED